MTLPACIQKIVDDGDAAARVAANLSNTDLVNNMAGLIYSHSMGYGVIANCNFNVQALTDNGMYLNFSEDKKTGRCNVVVKCR